MPELPEVETVVRALRPHLLTRGITSAQSLTDRLREPLPKDLSTKLSGKKITAITRRGKYIIVDLNGSPGLLLHLGMTGAFRVENAEAELQKHDRVSIDLDNGTSWRFEDIRKFGLFKLLDSEELAKLLQKLGPEPLTEDFNALYLKKRSHGRQTPVKVLLMDQMVVAGVGNIYASEALFRAGIHPRRAAGRISRVRYVVLCDAVKKVLQEAIEAGGTTISDYKSVDGSEGKFAIKLMVYGKEGDLCPRCGKTKIRKIVLGGRSSYYCGFCQH